MFKKIILFTFLLGIFIQNIFAAGDASQYIITIQQIEIFNGTTWIPLTNGLATDFDITSKLSGQDFGAWITKNDIPVGTYTQYRVTLSSTFQIKGNDGTYYTTASDGMAAGLGLASTTSTDEALKTVKIPFPLPSGVTLPSNVTLNATQLVLQDSLNLDVQEDAAINFQINFNTAGTINFFPVGPSLYNFMPGAPVVTVSFI